MDIQPSLLDRIETVDCFATVLPLKHPLVMSTYRIDSAETLFMRLRTRDGAEGWGEAAPNAVMTGETLAGMVAAVDRWVRPALLGRGILGCRHAIARDLSQLYGNGSVKAAVDMALLDLEGRMLGVPAVELLGGLRRSDARVMRLVDTQHDGREDLAETISEALSMRDNGFDAFKLKVGVSSSIQADVEALHRLRRELGPSALIGADANMGWDLATARRFATRAGAADLAFLEQPLSPNATADMTRLQEHADFPLSADEAIHKVSDILRLSAARAIEGVSLKANKLGGPSEVVRTASLCDALGLRVNLAMLLESSLSCAAMAHVACAIPQLDWAIVLGSAYLDVDPVTNPLRVTDGRVSPPQVPGLGIEVDERLIRRFCA